MTVFFLEKMTEPSCDEVKQTDDITYPKTHKVLWTDQIYTLSYQRKQCMPVWKRTCYKLFVSRHCM